MTQGIIVAFSGKIGSGKSSVSSQIAEVTGFSKASFGDYVRMLVQNRGGDSTSRQELQDEGQRQVTVDPTLFLSKTLEFYQYTPDVNFVIDGLRHMVVLEAMRASFKTHMLHIHLDAKTSKATERALSRGDDPEVVAKALRHAVEADVELDLLLAADLVVEADQPLEDLISKCTSEVEERIRRAK